MLRFAVRDIGRGIDPAFREQVFDNFTQQDTFDERRAAKAGVIDRRMIPRLRKLHEAGRLSGWRVWLLMVLQRWLELNRVTA